MNVSCVKGKNIKLSYTFLDYISRENRLGGRVWRHKVPTNFYGDKGMTAGFRQLSLTQKTS
jgi:hypothetical protein